jgi:Tat protein secretion system quality control protein TatD with DNase activity
MDARNPPSSATTPPQDVALAALEALGRLNTALAEELRALPHASNALLDAIQGDDDSEKEREITAFLERVDAFWNATSAQGNSRQELFTSSLQQALQQEIALKIHERDLWPDVAALCTTELPSTVRSYSLHI